MHQKINKAIERRKAELEKDDEFNKKVEAELEGLTREELQEYVKKEAYELSKLEAKPLK